MVYGDSFACEDKVEMAIGVPTRVRGRVLRTGTGEACGFLKKIKFMTPNQGIEISGDNTRFVCGPNYLAEFSKLEMTRFETESQVHEKKHHIVQLEFDH